MKKALFVTLGTLSLALGIIGIVVPGLPTTSFLLLAAFLYARSSDKLYNWLLNHKVFGKYIKQYRENKALSKNTKIYSLIMMWSMILLSSFVFIENIYVRIILISTGIVGTIIMLRIPTLKE
ncbi:MAG: YbaN family protein [Bacteroidales bacterium]|nr:YbaN family protein [Bacteroidales bacterium]MCF8403099.1 YbaN family protein [Bacteroidales bacterium]